MSTKRQSNTARRVLVVDDDAMVRLLARAALQNLNLDVAEADDGADAIETFQRSSFDLVLMDLEMPVMDGYTACAKMRQSPKGRDVPIMIATGLDDHLSIAKAYDAGATDFITKPISWPILTQRVRYLLRARNAFDELRRSETRLSDAQRIAGLGHWDWNIQNDEAEWSHAALRILGSKVRSNRASYSTFLEAVHPNDRSSVSRAVGQAIERRTHFGIEHRIARADGTVRTLFSQGTVLTDERGEPTLMRFVIQDITERKEAEERIYRLSYYDELTGLPNREMFIEYGDRMLLAARRDGTQAAVILVDIDRFKRINDSLGHTIGDELLKTVASRIAQTVRRSDLLAKIELQEDVPFSLARPGGDEFMILLRGLQHSDGVANFAQRIMDELALPVATKGGELFVSASAGVSLFPADGTDLSELLMSADTALAHAKSDGGNCFRFYARDMNVRAAERLSMESRLNRAVENEELQLYYQPQVSVVTGAVTGLEALLRWLPSGERPIPPAEFIPIAEESGLIVSLGNWVIRTACSQMAKWRQQGYAPVRVAVNLSSRQFTRQDLVETVTRALSASHIAPEHLELELTERLLMADIAEVRTKLHALKEVGVKLSVDDFGTGYSSMAYLKKFPLDAIKIDRSFISELGEDPADTAIVSSIVALSRGLHLSTIAEGVETAVQLKLLANLGCDNAQGYLVSRPIPAEEAISFLTPAGALTTL